MQGAWPCMGPPARPPLASRPSLPWPVAPMTDAGSAFMLWHPDPPPGGSPRRPLRRRVTGGTTAPRRGPWEKPGRTRRSPA